MSTELWDAEYASVQSIPSSDRFTSSLTLRNLLSECSPTGDTALDVGCGNGRNLSEISEYMDTVIGLDYSSEALFLANKHTDLDSEVIQAKIPDLPVKADVADIIVDSYVSCHFISQPEITAYFDEIERVASEGAQLYWIGVGVEDEYYSQFTETRTVLDPVNNISKRLYSLRDVKNSFEREYTVEYADSIIFEDTVNGEVYERDILVACFEL